MADIKITDQIIKSVDKVSLYNPYDGDLYTILSQLTNVTISQTQNTTFYTGKQGVNNNCQ